MTKQLSLFGVQYEEPAKENELTDHEYLEQQGQSTIFDYVEVIPNRKGPTTFLQGEEVKLRLYVDEVDYVQENFPHLMQPGVIFENHGSYYSVKFGNEIIKVDGEKLILL